MVFLEDIDDAQTAAAVVCHGEAHSVGAARDGEVPAQATRVAAIAQLALMLLRRYVRRARWRIARPETCVPQGQPGLVGPSSGIEPPLGIEKRTGHAGIVTEPAQGHAPLCGRVP